VAQILSALRLSGDAVPAEQAAPASTAQGRANGP
jgi:hypothetical protein